ncbi:glycosyltransferase involved in cell wall biosynthesis [Staphylococcus hominis]
MKSFTFLMHNIYALGGTVKAITELANTLSDHGHKVEIISIFRAKDIPYFKLNSSIKIKHLVDYRLKPQNVISILMNRLNKYTPLLKPIYLSKHEPGLNQFSKYIEHKLIRAINNVDTDVLIGTRASFNILISKYYHGQSMVVGMEHMNLNAYSKAYQQEILDAYQHLDVVTTLTEADKQQYQNLIDTPIYVIPNIIQARKLTLSKQNIILSAGRLEYEKGYDILIKSINIIKNMLRQKRYKIDIYGEGQEHQNLQQAINDYHLNDLITIHPATQQLNEKLAQSRITVVPSRNEGFGMVLLEAMAQDNIVISFKDTLGPSQLIQHNKNGYLADYTNAKSLAKYIDLAIQKGEHSENMIEASHQTLESYSPDKIYNAFYSIFK